MVNNAPRPRHEMISDDTHAASVALVLAAIHRNPGATRNEIARATGLGIQSVCARVGDLLDARLIHRGPRRPCSVTGRNNETLHALPPTLQTAIEAWT